jgi:protein-tyrosine phosphatase
MAEVLMAHAAAERAADAVLSSAGFATRGRPAEPHAVTVMADRGLHLEHHRSRIVTPELLADADLVVGMTREHVRQACTLDRNAFPRTFTLKELVRRGAAVGPAADGAGAWLDLVGQGRDPAGLLGQDPVDDIADPMGRSLRRFRSCADEIAAHTTTLADLVWPQTDP